jgi:hypothetical protein
MIISVDVVERGRGASLRSQADPNYEIAFEVAFTVNYGARLASLRRTSLDSLLTSVVSNRTLAGYSLCISKYRNRLRFRSGEENEYNHRQLGAS